jgi:hypothetical protein
MRKRATRPVTEDDRVRAAAAAAALRASLADPAAAGKRMVAHFLLARPRRGLWLATWHNLPGLSCDLGRKAYAHALLPGWEYTVRELRTELIEDLERLAEHGERPTEATR